MTLLSVLS